jgi:hypothetical protein
MYMQMLGIFLDGLAFFDLYQERSLVHQESL